MLIVPDSPRIEVAAAMPLSAFHTRCPHYHMVPKGLLQNLRFRRTVIQRAEQDKDFVRGVWQMCAEDPLFYINTFAWTYAPKLFPQMPVYPFITWPYQDEAILGLNDAIDFGEDRAIRKSRDMGASWIGLLVIDWRYRFIPMQSFLIGSRKEDLVDKPGNPVSLMWKLDFIERHLPPFLRPSDTRRVWLHKENNDNGSVIDGESMNEDFGRGDRRTMVFLDEFASWIYGTAVLHATSDVTDCRILNSTPKGVGNAFYEQYQLMLEMNRIVDMHWTRHPEKARGLYYDANGKPRSPWYDGECRRRSPMEVAQELDMDFHGSDYTFFEEEVLRAVRMRDVRNPILRGELLFDRDTLEPIEFVENRNGPLLLWVAPDEKGHVPADCDYVMGVDTAAGTTDSTGRGASNSAAGVGNVTTGEKVAEFAVSGMLPEEFAKNVIALGKWFKGIGGLAAFAIPENAGPGAQLCKVLMDRKYPRMYYRTDERRLGAKPSTMPGWYPTRESKNVLLGEYRAALASGDFVQRSAVALDECRSYVFTNGAVMHSRAAVSDDPTGARENHGDRVIMDALTSKGIRLLRREPRRPRQRVPVSSFAGRRLERQRLRERQLARSGKEGWL